MRRHILTGAPGAGKTTIADRLARTGRTVVAEAATDLIRTAQAAGDPRPWTDPGFCEATAALQRDRRHDADRLPGPDQYFDRSPVCTLALARFLGHPVGPVLAAELDRAAADYAPTVLFVDLLDTLTPTAVRRISLPEARAFAQVHLDAYTEYGFQIARIPAGTEADRTALALRLTRP
ncbi:Predicted ATPase [Glycomyces sambucus]|uniref:Predicted ATPase n=1 Tax=Glycomyces sambucus TaxID=380244 RepID=A0A1G9F7W3_9ACTN|nr:AAA family ATPase [Glycomyces sambucus]SDK84435.1 Predicted ATPase [Glycomyces sambucus]